MTCKRNIKLLPPEIISNLRSCVAISSVSQCVEELVLNAVDSCAKNIAVRLDLTFYKIQVVDNGFGIPCDQLDLLGERYHTSKCHSLDDLKNLRYNGFRGEALASLRDICAVLEITSRTQDNRTYFKAFHYGKSTEVRLSVDERPSAGTTVTILDFMYNLPVRRKSICTFRDFEFTRRSLECIALVNPNVSFTLRNNQTGETCLNTRRTNSMISSFRHLFGCDKSLKEIVYHSDGIKVQGFVSTDSHSTNELQFLFVNCRLVLKTRLHELVRLVLAKYIHSKPRECTEIISSDGAASPKKSGQPIFAFNIMCPFNEYDICFEPRKTLIEFEDWDKVTGVIKDVLRTFLNDEGYKFEDEDKYLKASPASTSAAYSDANSTAIDTTNSKNALFSLVIKRPKPKRRQQKNSRTKNKNKDESPSEDKQTSSLPPSCNHRDFSSGTCHSTYPHSVEKEYTENRTLVQDPFVPFNTHNHHNWYEDSRLKAGSCVKEVSARVGSQFRTIPSPVALHFNSKQSSLTALRNRKRKESKLKELKETFEFQRPGKATKMATKSGHKSSAVFQDQMSGRQNQRFQKNISVKDLSPPPISFHSFSSSSDIMDFSELDTNIDTDYSEGRSSVPNVQKSPDDKWSILSQSQDIINETEPFLVTPPVSVPPRVDSDISTRSNTAAKTASSSLEQDLFNFLDSSPSPGPNNKLGSRPPQHRSNFNSDITNKTDQLFSYKHRRSETATQGMSALSAHSNVCVPNPSPSTVNSSTNLEQGISGVSMSKGKRDAVSVSHSIGSATQFFDNKLKPITDVQSDKPDWIKWQDLDSGNILYINMATGNSSYVPPPSNKTTIVHSQRRDGHFFLSHNSTPFLPRPERKVNNVEDCTLGTNKNLSDMLETWQNPVFKRTDFKEISNVPHFLRKPTIRVYNIVQNYKFFKSMFERAELLGQVDCKFIACLVPNDEMSKESNLLALFDQHAVHERIRLEQFTKDLYSQSGEVQSSTLQVPLRLEVAAEYARLARIYSNQLEKMTGLGIVEEQSPCSAALSFRCVPTCLTEREASELKNNRPSVLASLTKSLLEEQLQKLKETGSLTGPVPKTLHTVLSSRACKGAIKFGDSLNKEDCSQLVRRLSNCQLPFQCAHGRPSVIPVFDVTHISRPLHWKVQRPRLFRLSVVKSKHVM